MHTAEWDVGGYYYTGGHVAGIVGFRTENMALAVFNGKKKKK